MSKYLKIFLVAAISTVISGIVSWIIGRLDLEYNTLLLIMQGTITVFLIIIWVLISEKNKDKSSLNAIKYFDIFS